MGIQSKKKNRFKRMIEQYLMWFGIMNLFFILIYVLIDIHFFRTILSYYSFTWWIIGNIPELLLFFAIGLMVVFFLRILSIIEYLGSYRLLYLIFMVLIFLITGLMQFYISMFLGALRFII